MFQRERSGTLNRGFARLSVAAVGSQERATQLVARCLASDGSQMQPHSQWDPFIQNVVTKLLKHGLKLSKDVEPNDALDLYQTSLGDLPTDAVESVCDGLFKGKYEKHATFLPRPVEFANLARQKIASHPENRLGHDVTVERQLEETRAYIKRLNSTDEERAKRREARIRIESRHFPPQSKKFSRSK